MIPDLTLVLGGAASGKSALAESLVERGSPNRLYIATAKAFDAEMEHKIAIHRDRRGQGWRTLEAPENAVEALGQALPEEVVLFDCATMWLSNIMLADGDIPTERGNLLAALAACPAPVVVVTNEVGGGIVPENALARAFREEQGRLNIALAAQADCAVQVVAGLPNVLKGMIW